MSTVQVTWEVCLTKSLGKSCNILCGGTVSHQFYDHVDVIGMANSNIEKIIFHKLYVLLWYRQYIYQDIESSFFEFDFSYTVASIYLNFYLQ